MSKTDKQNGFTLLNTRLQRVGKADSTGFIPMIIMILLILGLIIWFVYSRVSSSH